MCLFLVAAHPGYPGLKNLHPWHYLHCRDRDTGNYNTPCREKHGDYTAPTSYLNVTVFLSNNVLRLFQPIVQCVNIVF